MSAPQPPTLGDLLYSDEGKVRLSETDWLELVNEIADGKVQGMKALYQRAGSLVFRLALLITRNREDAEEVTLDVFEDIWHRASGYDAATGSVLGWVMNLTRSRALEIASSSDSKNSKVGQRSGEPVSTIKNCIRSGSLAREGIL